VAPAGTPETVAAEARGWLHWLSQRVPLTDPPQRVSRKLLCDEKLLPLAVLGYFKSPDGFFAAVPAPVPLQERVVPVSSPGAFELAHVCPVLPLEHVWSL
jgi:hypothetical protein